MKYLHICCWGISKNVMEVLWLFNCKNNSLTFSWAIFWKILTINSNSFSKVLVKVYYSNENYNESEILSIFDQTSFAKYIQIHHMADTFKLRSFEFVQPVVRILPTSYGICIFRTVEISDTHMPIRMCV